MFHLGRYYDIYDENRRHTYLFWPSLRQSLYLSLVSPRMFEPARHYTFGTNRHFTEITRDEIGDVTTAMEIARRAFLEGGGMMRALSMASDNDLRAVLGKIDMFGGGWTRGQPLDNSRQLWDAVLRAVRESALIFVPEREDLRACVKAIQEDRKKRPAPLAQRPQDTNPYATVQQMMAKPPRLPSGLSTPLGDAQSFVYLPDMPDGDVDDVAGMPFKGEPNTWISSMPGKMPQLRQFGPDGTPLTDFDLEAHHGNPNPHAHNWGADGRDDGAPVSLLPW
jgi:hypothetical protein